MLDDHAMEWEGQGNATKNCSGCSCCPSCPGAGKHFWILNLGFDFMLFGLQILIRMAMGSREVALAGREVHTAGPPAPRLLGVKLAPVSLTHTAIGTMDVI